MVSRLATPGTHTRGWGSLEGNGPGIDHRELIVVTLPAERARLSPRLDHEVVALLETLPVERRVGVVGELLVAAASHDAGNQTAPDIMSIMGRLLRQLNRVSQVGMGFPQLNDL